VADFGRFFVFLWRLRTLRSTAPVCQNQGSDLRAASRVAISLLPRKTPKIKAKIDPKSLKVACHGHIRGQSGIGFGRFGPIRRPDGIGFGRSGRTRPKDDVGLASFEAIRTKQVSPDFRQSQALCTNLRIYTYIYMYMI